MQTKVHVMGRSEGVGTPSVRAPSSLLGALVTALAALAVSCGTGESVSTEPPATEQPAAASPDEVVLASTDAPEGMALRLELDGPEAIAALESLSTLADGDEVLDLASIESVAVSVFVTPRPEDELLTSGEDGRALVTGAVALADAESFAEMLPMVEALVGDLGESYRPFDVDLGDESVGFDTSGGAIAGDATVAVWRDGTLAMVVVAQGSGAHELALQTASVVVERAAGGSS